MRGTLLWGLVLLMGCDPFGTGFPEDAPAVRYTASQVEAGTAGSTLTVATYNVKFGGGRIDFFFDCHGSRVLMSEAEVLTNLGRLAEIIVRMDPDVLFIQEVDVLSKRSAYVDQVQWLLDHTRLNYAVYASQWKADFVPSDGLGPVDSGNAILSKFPLKDARRLALPLRTDQSSIERYFYLQRNLLVADLDVASPVRLVGTHAAAYSKDGTKRTQIERFQDQLDRAPGLVIGAGDLNALPPGATQTQDFADSVCLDEAFQADDYSAETQWLRPLYDRYQTAIPLQDYQADEAKSFTHTTDSQGFWNRKLDYIFTNAEIVPGSGHTHQDASRLGVQTMPASDHAPLSVQVVLP